MAANDYGRDKERDFIDQTRLEHQTCEQRTSFNQHALNRSLAQFIERGREIERGTFLANHFYPARLERS